MAQNPKAIPEGTHTITPHLSVRDAAKAIEFYQQAFRAKLTFLHKWPNGKVMHATLKLGDSRFQLAEAAALAEAAEPRAPVEYPVVLNICVENVDELFNRAVAAGARVTAPLENQFWGARYGQIIDPFGHMWAIFSHVEDVSPEELERRANAAFAGATKTAAA